VPKDWEVGLGVGRDEFFSILPKFLDWETVLGTLGDALRENSLFEAVKVASSFLGCPKFKIPYMTLSPSLVPYMTLPSLLSTNSVK